MKTLALLVAAGLLATRPIHAQEPTKFEVGTHGGATILLPDGGDAEFVVGVPGAGTALGLFPPILSAGDHRVVWPCSASREYWPSIEKGQPAAGAGQMGVRTFRQQRRPPGFRGTSRRAALRPASNWRTAAPGSRSVVVRSSARVLRQAAGPKGCHTLRAGISRPRGLPHQPL
jgi:hypothetical protein